MVCELKTYRIEEIEFINNLKPNVKIELGNKFSYNVGYSPNNICKGEFTCEINDKNSPDNFSIKVKMIGVFTHEPHAGKDIVHRESFKIIMPFVRAAVATITTAAGMPPVMMPFFDIENQDIYRLEINKPE